MPWIAPKRRTWLVVTSAIAAASFGLFAVLAWLSPWSPGRFWGLTFGTLASVIFLFDALYPLRRRLLAWPLRTAQDWLQLHIYGGMLACLFVLIHAGFRLPGGAFGWWLLLLTLWTTASGLFGVWLQKWIPTIVTGNLSVEAIYERAPELAGRLRGEADTLVEGTSDVLSQFYRNDVRERLETVRPSWSYVLDPRAGREMRLAGFRDVAAFLTPEEQAKLNDLQVIMVEKLELDAHYSLQRLMRLWIVTHLPASMMLMGLTAVHILLVWLL
jgi:hypothetical protein